MQSGHSPNDDNQPNTQSNTQTLFNFFGQNTDMRSEVFAYLSVPDRVNLLLSSLRWDVFPRHLVSEILREAAASAAPESDTQTDQTKLAAIALLKTFPKQIQIKLLFEKGNVTDHHGRVIKGSPYQIFLGAGDVWAIKQIHEEILDQIQDSAAKAAAHTKAQAQFKEQFPNYDKKLKKDEDEEVRLYDDRNKALIAAVIQQLNVIKAAINLDPCTNGQATLPATIQAVDNLRKLFAPKANDVIQTGLHFPLGILKEIYKVHEANFDPWTIAPLAFFSREAIGSAEACLSAVDGQCVKEGLSNLNQATGPDRTDGLFCARPKGVPANKAPLKGKLGVTLFTDPIDDTLCFQSAVVGKLDWYNKNGRGGELVVAGVVPGHCACGHGGLVGWETYAKQKQQLFRDITQCIAKQSTHYHADVQQQVRCVIV